MKKLFALTALLAFFISAEAQEIVAHRGYWKDNAQNSIASLQKAQAFGCWGSEFDLHLTADNFVVVNHDGRSKKPTSRKAPSKKSAVSPSRTENLSPPWKNTWSRAKKTKTAF